MLTFVHRLTLRLHHTDATGVLFFGHQLGLVMETFEEFLAHRGFSLKEWLASPYFFPVVHAKTDYLAPLGVGALLDIALTVASVGSSSVTLHYALESEGRVVGRAEVVHVLVDKETRSPVPLPSALRSLFITSEVAYVADDP